MLYTLIFLTFELDEMYRYVFYTYIFVKRKISITSKMFYFLDTPVSCILEVSAFSYKIAYQVLL